MGIVKLQAAGHIGAYHLPEIPQVSWLGLAPTLQGAGTQAVMLAVPAVTWLLFRPRRSVA